jgi:hypothetical protein
MRGDPSDLEHEDPQGRWDPQDLWQAQNKELDPVTLAQIHVKAAAFEKFVHRRNAREYLSLAFAVVLTGVAGLLVPHMHPLVRLGAVCMALGAIFAGWQLYKRGTPEATPQPGESLLDTYRRQLIQQRDIGRTGFWWYILPMIPGPALILLGAWLKGPAPGKVMRFYVTMPLAILALIAAFGFSAWYVRRGVRRLQKMIDDLG